jgi:hypothetical protein
MSGVAETIISGVSAVKAVLGLLLTFVVVCLLTMVLWRIYEEYSTGGDRDRTFHPCQQCGQRFRCRELASAPIPQHAVAPTVAGSGAKSKSAESVSRRGPPKLSVAQANRRRIGDPLGQIRRKTVNIGAMPLEVTNMVQNKCCNSFVARTGKLERFCSWNCYRQRLTKV